VTVASVEDAADHMSGHEELGCLIDAASRLLALRVAGERLIAYDIAGDGFLRHMVRSIVGTLVEVGQRRRTPESIREVLARRNRSAAGPTAPARGLFLVGVDYGALAAEP